MQVRDRLYINGEWVLPQGKGVIEILNPATERVIGTIPEGAAEDATAAANAARAAFERWAGSSREERAALLTKMHQALAARSDEIAATISSEVGMPFKLSQRIQAGLPAAVMESYSRLIVDYPFEE